MTRSLCTTLSNCRAVLFVLIPVLIVLLFSPIATNTGVCATNPLTGKPSPPVESSVVSQPQKSSVFSGIVSRITMLQLHLRQQIASYVHAFKKEGNIFPLLPLFLLCFGYGAVHAAGPGHGKAIAITYALTRNRSYGSGILLGFLIAIIHACSAVFLVLMLRMLLNRTVTSSLASATQITQVVSYIMICIIGLYLTISGLLAWRKGEDSGSEQVGKLVASPITAAVTIGIVPCPGVIMILLFCLSLGQMVLGILLCASVSIGMAITITMAVWLALAGKKLTLSFTDKDSRGLHNVEHGMNFFSGLILTSLGVLLLAASL